MNSKEYKEIARIINECTDFNKNPNTLDMDSEKFIDELVSHFERNQCIDDTCDCHILGKMIKCCIVCSPHKDNIFNRKQFLKECGVE